MDDLVVREGLYFKKFTDTPFSGELKEGMSQGKIKDGRRVGKWAFYHDNGQIKWRGNYKNGYREGEWTLYDFSGELREKGKFEQGKKEGVWKNYSGEKVIHEDEYKNGDQETRIEYFENGNIRSKASYKSGKLNGPYIEYFENSRDITAKGNYKDGKRDGYWEFFDTPGKKRLGEKETYKDGRLHGPWVGYYDNGQLYSEGIYKDGEKDGPWVSYKKNGKLMDKGIYKDGKKISD